MQAAVSELLTEYCGAQRRGSSYLSPAVELWFARTKGEETGMVPGGGTSNMLCTRVMNAPVGGT